LWVNPHLRESGFFQSYRDQDGERTERELPTVPWRFDGQREGSFTGQPRRGQHNSYVCDQLLGLAEGEVEILLEEQVIY
jgi:crotonobetainyl-CoA:carnitine CoA-transferase CaiB-like acyl-CoA transferase